MRCLYATVPIANAYARICRHLQESPIHPDDGEMIDIMAVDTVYVDENSKGTWEVLETVRKSYLAFNEETSTDDDERIRHLFPSTGGGKQL